jgi:hypothetical protein
MTLPSLTKLLLKAKKGKNLSFEDLGNLINRDEVWVASLFYGQATASEEEATQTSSRLIKFPKSSNDRFFPFFAFNNNLVNDGKVMINFDFFLVGEAKSPLLLLLFLLINASQDAFLFLNI